MIYGAGPAGALLRRLLTAVLVAPLLAAVVLRAWQAAVGLEDGTMILMLIGFVSATMLVVSISFAGRLDSAELALRTSEQRHRSIVEAAHEAFISMDASGVIRAWNPMAEEIFGWPASAAIGRTVAETIIPPELREAHRAGIRRFLAGGEPRMSGRRLELAAVHLDGRKLTVELTISASHDEQDWSFDAFLHDVTERRRIQDEAERLSTIVNSASDAIVSYDLEGTITSWNRSAERLYGYTATEAIGETTAVFTPASDQEAMDAVHARIRDRARSETFEAVRERKDGGRVDVAVAAAPIRDAQGNLVGISGSARDITERNRQRRELERQNAELERSNDELEQFAYVASHDLQEPLRVIAGFVELLQQRYQGQLDDDADRFIGATVSGVERMRQLIDDLLRYSRVGRAEIVREEIDLNRTVTEVLDLLERPLTESEIDVRLEPLPVIDADPTLISQVFQNLISNAVKFADGDSPRVVVSGAEENGGWHLQVADNGPGIEERHRHRIFEMFKRLHGRSVPGTGIGLAICKRVTERHGGRIWVESEPGEGSTFHFTIGRATAR